MKKIRRYLMFALLYFAQGSIMSFFTSLNSMYLQTFDLSMSRIGIVGTIAMIPFVIKIFLGYLSDRINFFGLGYRKPYIVIGLLVQTAGLLLVPHLHPASQFGLYAGTVFILVTGMALYDTCTDGLALDSTPVEEEGIIQGYMVGGRAVGMVLVSAIMGLLVERYSWNFGYYFLAIVTLLPLPFVLLAKEPERSRSSKFDWKAFKSFGKPDVIGLGILGALYSLIIYGANQLVNPYLSSEFTISYATAGFVTTVLGLGIVLGSLAGGKMTDRIGQKRSVQSALVVSMISIALLALIVRPWMAWLLVFFFGVAFGFYETVFFAISMRITDGRIAATMFSILMAVANIGTGIGLAVTGVLSDNIGYRLTFVLLSLLNLSVLPFLKMIFNPKTD